MKNVSISTWNVEVKARAPYSEKANKKDTMYMLNHLSLLAIKASEKYEQEGFAALAEEAYETSNEIHQLLTELGFYKED